MDEIPVKALGKEAREILSSLLNPEKIFPTDENLPRDWRGLAQLCSIGGEHLPNIQRCDDPVKKILQIWSAKNGTESTIDKLLSFLKKLERWDVFDDITPLVEKDIEYFKSNTKAVCVDPPDSDDEEILTYDDAKRKLERKPLQIYDAFVLFDDEDINFATNIVQTLEGEHSMKLCVKDRDVVGGKLEDLSIINKISTRCRKIIVVVSPSFWNSLTNRYLYNMVRLDSLEKRCSKIIPCLERPCAVPIEFRMYHTLILSRNHGLFGDFWVQLFEAIKAPPLKEKNTIREKRTETPVNNLNHVKFETEGTKDDKPTPKENNIPTKTTSEEKSVVQGVKKKSFFSKIHKRIKSKKQEDKNISPVNSDIQKQSKRKIKILAS